MKKCDVNSWDGYGLCMLFNWRGLINSDLPIYEFYNQDGALSFQTADARHLDDYKKKGYRIEVADKEKLRKENESSIERVTKKVEKWQINKCACDDPECDGCLRVHCKNDNCKIHLAERKKQAGRE
ncbi:MAG: hypothetical protein Q7R72_01910 [bacterium]|nr:hypothetical protein [bacterium]